MIFVFASGYWSDKTGWNVMQTNNFTKHTMQSQ